MMGMEKDVRFSLELAMTRIHVAQDMLHWSLSADSMTVISKDEINEIREKLRQMERKLWNTLSRGQVKS